jgi:hypothetical protein
MGGSKLTSIEIERRDKEHKRYSALFQRIKRLFHNHEVKISLYNLKSSFSNNFIANVFILPKRLSDNKNINLNLNYN